MKLQITALVCFAAIVALSLPSCSDQKGYNPVSAVEPDPVQQPHMTIEQMKGQVLEAEQKLQEGDLLVRAGREPVSRIIRTFNRKDPSYSHAGLVFIENGKPWVYHILPAEDSLKPERIRRDSIPVFCNPLQNDGFGIFRYQLKPDQLAKLKAVIVEHYKQGILFDDRFDMRTDHKMYCSEMIAKALSAATAGTLKVETVQTTPAEASFFANRLHATIKEVMDRRIVPIDNLYLNPQCAEITRIRFDSLTVR